MLIFPDKEAKLISLDRVKPRGKRFPSKDFL